MKPPPLIALFYTKPPSQAVPARSCACQVTFFKLSGKNNAEKFDVIIIEFGTVFAEYIMRGLSCHTESVIYMYNPIKPIEEMNIKPLGDRVLVQPTAAEEVTMSGIIIPDSAKEKPLRGKVLAAGNGTKDEDMILKAGDEVLYGKYAGTEIEFEGEKYLIMRQSDVLAVIA